MRQDQLGGAIGEDLARDFPAAGRAYQALEKNFVDLGDLDAARWAYLKRRRMEKFAAFAQARAAFRERRWRAALNASASFANDQAVEWLCDYGESVPRVLATLASVVLLFALLYGASGSVAAVTETPKGPVKAITHNPVELIIFSLLAMTTSGSPAVGLVPSNEAVHLITGLQASLGIALTGLLGFVLGNRIRR
jgi:hypothetical protein